MFNWKTAQQLTLTLKVKGSQKFFVSYRFCSYFEQTTLCISRYLPFSSHAGISYMQFQTTSLFQMYPSNNFASLHIRYFICTLLYSCCKHFQYSTVVCYMVYLSFLFSLLTRYLILMKWSACSILHLQ